uniref:Uncharacterized protein n=1 Tax=Schistocephalus solidus TaxID=70667 RepID=A0A0X3P3E1_SCHSO
MRAETADRSSRKQDFAHVYKKLKRRFSRIEEHMLKQNYQIAVVRQVAAICYTIQQCPVRGVIGEPSNPIIDQMVILEDLQRSVATSKDHSYRHRPTSPPKRAQR